MFMYRKKESTGQQTQNLHYCYFNMFSIFIIHTLVYDWSFVSFILMSIRTLIHE